jgi:tetratricopeptide (TPR) repeat protein
MAALRRLVMLAALVAAVAQPAGGGRAQDSPSMATAVADSAVSRAVGLVSRGRLDQAVGLLEKLVGADPGNAEALAALGAAYSDMGQKEKAATVLRRALELRPDDSRTRANLGNAYTDLKQYDAAVLELARVLEGAPHDAEAHINLAVAYGAGGNLEASYAQLQEAQALSPDQPLIYLNLGRYYAARSEWSQAIAALVRLREIDAWYPMGEEMLRQILGQARGDLQRRAAKDPADAACHYGLGWCAAYDGDMKKARKEAEKALQQDPGRAASLRAKGEFCSQLGKLDDAIDAFRAAIAADSSDWAGYSLLGQAYVAQGRAQDALAILERAPRGSHVISVQMNMGVALSSLERHSEAGAAFRRAGALGANNAIQRFNLAACCFNTKDYASAWVEARAAQRMGHRGAEALIARLAKVSREPE